MNNEKAKSQETRYSIEYDARKKSFIDYARARGHNESAEYLLYGFESGVINRLSFKVYEAGEYRESTQDDLSRKIEILGVNYHAPCPNSNDSVPNGIQEIDAFLRSLEGKVIELGEIALCDFNFKTHPRNLLQIDIFEPKSPYGYSLIKCNYGLANVGYDLGRVWIKCGEKTKLKSLI